MSDVRGLVGINAGVLDQNFAVRDFGWRFLIGAKCRAIQARSILTLR